jgi:hypothetical protein
MPGLLRIEDGTTRNPRFDTVEVLCEKLDVTAAYFSNPAQGMPDFPRTAVAEALERYIATDGRADLRQRLERAAEVTDAPQTVAHWRAFVLMSERAWWRGARKRRKGEQRTLYFPRRPKDDSVG